MQGDNKVWVHGRRMAHDDRGARTVDGTHQGRADGDGDQACALADGDGDGEDQQGGAQAFDGELLRQSRHLVCSVVNRAARGLRGRCSAAGFDARFVVFVIAFVDCSFFFDEKVQKYRKIAED